MSNKSNNHTYYNVVIPYDPKQVTVVNAPMLCQFLETRGQPIIDKMEEYQMAITRFSLPAFTIPIFIWEPLNANYTVSMDFNGSNSTQVSLIYVPNNSLSSTDPTYYYIYSYQQFLDYINTALATAFASLASKPIGATAPPYLIYDATTNLISLIAQQAYTPNSDPKSSLNLRVYFNSLLYDFFGNFQSNFLGYNQTLGKDYQLYIKNNYNNSITIPTGAPGATSLGWQMIQPFPALYLFNSFRSLVITSGSVPVAKESTPTLTNEGQIVQGSTNYLSILADFEPEISNGFNARSVFQYVPAFYRYIDIVGKGALSTFDLAVYWRDIHDHLFPLYLNAQDVASFKFVFIKKDITIN